MKYIAESNVKTGKVIIYIKKTCYFSLFNFDHHYTKTIMLNQFNKQPHVKNKNREESFHKHQQYPIKGIDKT